MPVDDFIDIRSNDLTIQDLQKLDREAAKAEKRLKKLQKRGGIFAESTAGTTDPNKAAVEFIPTPKLSKQDQRFEKRIQRIQAKSDRDFVKQFGKNKDTITRQIFGDNLTAQNLFSIGRNPIGFLQNTLIGAAGIGFIVQVAQAVLQEVQRIDRFFKVFIDIIDTRNDQTRSREQQALIQAGQQQIISTTRAGSVDTRDSYNTFNEFNTNRAELQNDFSIRNTSGVND